MLTPFSITYHATLDKPAEGVAGITIKVWDRVPYSTVDIAIEFGNSLMCLLDRDQAAELAGKLRAAIATLAPLPEPTEQPAGIEPVSAGLDSIPVPSNPWQIDNDTPF